MGLFGKKRMGKLTVKVDYTTRSNFSMTVTIRELKLTTPIAYEGKTFDVPAGIYTVALKGLMSDQQYGGGYHGVYKGVYGSFERRQTVVVPADQEATCIFDLPKVPLAVTIQVVADGTPLVGAEVLIKEVDPNFRVTRKEEGALFHLEPGSYPVVVVHGSALMKEAIHVSEQETAFVLDLSQQKALRPSLVVVRYRDGRVVKGVTEDFAPGAARFSVEQENRQRVPIEGFGEVKAVFFVKDLEGNRLYQKPKDFVDASQFGRKTVVVFADQDTLFGFTLPGHTDQSQFFLFPADPKSNNAKVYVVRGATAEIRFA